MTKVIYKNRDLKFFLFLLITEESCRQTGSSWRCETCRSRRRSSREGWKGKGWEERWVDWWWTAWHILWTIFSLLLLRWKKVTRWWRMCDVIAPSYGNFFRYHLIHSLSSPSQTMSHWSCSIENAHPGKHKIYLNYVYIQLYYLFS